MKQKTTLLLGIILILIGAGYLCNALFHWHFSIFFNGWWTLFLIIPSIVKMATSGIKRSYVILLLSGIFLLIISNLPSMLIFPVFVILTGIFILYHTFSSPKNTQQHNYRFSSARSNTNNHWNHAENDFSDFPTYSVTFSKSVVQNTSNNLTGGKIEVFMGSADVDFSMALIKDDITIDVTSVTGTANIIIPKNIKLNIITSNILGTTDFSQAKGLSPETTAPTVTVKCHSIMASIIITTK